MQQLFFRIWKRRELAAWILALVLLYFLPAGLSQTSFCPLSLLGLGSCPGCGIGHAIHYALHGEWRLSWQHHFMGIPAVLIIFMRIVRLLYPSKNHYETQFH
jgi:hypothetical protein